MTMPYIIRDELGYWHTYDLPTAWDDRAVGIDLIIMMQPGETLDCQTILNALQPALKPALPGEWYLINLKNGRYIRKLPNTSAEILSMLNLNEHVQIVEIIKSPPGTWGRVIAVKSTAGVVKAQAGFIYLDNLKKE